MSDLFQDEIMNSRSIAAYAGSTLPQAEQFLQTVKAAGRFPGANLRRMQAVLVYP
jgi:hypothetical protein